MKRAIGGAFLLIFFLLAKPVHASIVLNEFLIDPAPQQVELLNTAEGEVDISGFFIDDSGGSTYFTVPDGTKIAGKSCVVFSHDFNFNKSSSDSIRLFDKTTPPASDGAHVIDSYSYESSPGEGISYQRIPDGEGSWTSKVTTLGSKNEDGLPCTSSSVTPTPSPPGEASQTYDNIYISEAFVHPSANENEWVEFYNNNDFEVTLIRWYIDDLIDSGSSAKQFTLKIPAKSYAAYTLPTAMFNNDGDTITLLDAEKNIQHQVSYENSQEGQTVGPTSFSSHGTCLRHPTEGRANGDCTVVATSPTKSPTPIKTPTPTKKTERQNTVMATKNSPRSKKRAISGKSVQATTHSLPQGPKVLGASQKNTPSKSLFFVKTLSFLGILYAVLAFSSIAYKLHKKTSNL